MKRREFISLAGVGIGAVAMTGLNAAEPDLLRVPGESGGIVKRIPISLGGFSGDAASVLSFDLEVMGCEIVAPDKARFSVSGSNDGVVAGELKDSVTKASLFNNRYSGGSLRTQAHTLANDVIEKITGHHGIAGTQIAFKGENGGKMEIYISDFDGWKPSMVTNDGAVVAAPTWVPGQRILYYTSYKAGGPDVYSHNLGTGARKAVAQYQGMNSSAAVSPDGRRVAMIISYLSGNPDVCVADADGRNLKQLTHVRKLEQASSPCWSPDGQRICYVLSMSGRSDLRVIPASGGESRQIKVGGGRVSEPDWSPNGKKIVFTVMRGEFEICVAPAEGGEATTLTAGEDPSWAPNSRTVIFTRRARGRSILSLLDVPTKHVKDVPQSLGNSSQPSWAK